jgi:succinate dehydrogenase / fumarate reductase iron-sulfur subunit
MRVQLKIRRFNPETDQKPWWGSYEVEAEPTDRVLDALHYVKWYVDGSLTLRRSCAHGMCGSDAMRINGHTRLACKVLIKDAGRRITVEPLLAFPVVKDLVVDMQPFMALYRSILPYLINDDPPPVSERLQSRDQRERFDDTTKCILCGICTSACPSYWARGDFLGPAAIAQAHRFIFDSRDQASQERLDILSQPNGVWRCRSIYNCTEACPRAIQITQAIAETKKEMIVRRT